MKPLEDGEESPEIRWSAVVLWITSLVSLSSDCYSLSQRGVTGNSLKALDLFLNLT